MRSSFPSIHPWNVTAKEAIEIQNELRQSVLREDSLGAIHVAAGYDVGFTEGGRIAHAAIAALKFPGLELLETESAQMEVTFPYVPGLLSFREAPVILNALEKLKSAPDLLICDGQGLAHPRRFGLACHVGVLTGIPSIGAAKSRLIGEHTAVGENRGDWTPLMDGEEIIGASLRTRPGSKPIYVSIGHRVSLERAIELVLLCTATYRLPEPTRLAHNLASKKST